jgi:hypothetical protein
LPGTGVLALDVEISFGHGVTGLEGYKDMVFVNKKAALPNASQFDNYVDGGVQQNLFDELTLYCDKQEFFGGNLLFLLKYDTLVSQI